VPSAINFFLILKSNVSGHSLTTDDFAKVDHIGCQLNFWCCDISLDYQQNLKGASCDLVDHKNSKIGLEGSGTDQCDLQCEGCDDRALGSENTD
jgi:hypothetical protein